MYVFIFYLNQDRIHITTKGNEWAENLIPTYMLWINIWKCINIYMYVHKETIYNNITFRKFISDNIILFGMTVTFCSKTFRLSVMLLKNIECVREP